MTSKMKSSNNREEIEVNSKGKQERYHSAVIISFNQEGKGVYEKEEKKPLL